MTSLNLQFLTISVIFVVNVISDFTILSAHILQTVEKSQYRNSSVQKSRDIGPEYLNNIGNEANLLPTYKGLLPFIESGACQKGWEYTIHHGDDLLKYEHELECIFFAGIPVSKVPEGPLYGTILSILNTEQFNTIVNLVWWGKLVTEVPCQGPDSPGRTVFVGWNNLLSQFLVPFLARIGPIEENLAPGEYNDGIPSMIIDYTQDFAQICNDFGDTFGPEFPVRNVYPLNQIVDALRLVGRQVDGGAIYLGKTYLRDSFRWSSTVLYFYFLNYDQFVNPEFGPGQPLPPLINSFTYAIPGMGRMVI